MRARPLVLAWEAAFVILVLAWLVVVSVGGETLGLPGGRRRLGL